MLLSREQFREQVFARDKYKCVFCPLPAVDAHHILERRLFPDGGYYLNNGASVCADHHLRCEMTKLSVEDVRRAAGITVAALPPHLYADQVYDKWGNPVLPNGARLKGELFHDESVQKVLASGGVLDLYTHFVKYPRTYHLPWSPGMNDDDRMMDDMSHFIGRRVIVTEKMDGENTTLYCDYIHARSIDGPSHHSRNWVKNFWSGIAQDIPDGWRICGENLFAKHSIAYDSLPSYFMGFSVWDDRNICLSWDETMEWFRLLEITPVPVLYDGILGDDTHFQVDSNTQEGYIMRLAGTFAYREFSRSVGKFVRADHVQTAEHWRLGKPIVKNNLA